LYESVALTQSVHFPGTRGPEAERGAPWLEAFHAGDRGVIEGAYRAHFVTVERALGGLLGPADRETVIHELFSKLLTNGDFRRAFTGGSFVAWLTTVARNQAIDFQRRRGREVPLEDEAPPMPGGSWQDAAEARVLIERFRRERLPPDWVGVFERRFLEQLTQHEAARALGIRRTTLAYRELRIRRALRAFLLEEEENEES
jgi:RNA polymerase sigma-70 factor (ECF subfamily)